jgi:CBS-domain-containing membrane protein
MSAGLLPRLFPPQAPMSWREGLYSALAAGVAIAVNAWVSHLLLPGGYQVYLAASMGASTILAMVVYHSPLSQPWAIVGGHAAGAASGLLAAALVPHPVLACLLAMSLTVLIQVPARCLHAPGGGTALLPILAGAAIQPEGVGFIGVVLVNALVLVTAALAFNNLLPGRRYPTAFVPRPVAPVEPVFREEDLLSALRAMHGFIDVSPEDLEQIYEKARDHLRQHWDGVRTARK